MSNIYWIDGQLEREGTALDITFNYNQALKSSWLVFAENALSIRSRLFHKWNFQCICFPDWAQLRVWVPGEGKSCPKYCSRPYRKWDQSCWIKLNFSRLQNAPKVLWEQLEHTHTQLGFKEKISRKVLRFYSLDFPWHHSFLVRMLKWNINQSPGSFLCMCILFWFLEKQDAVF